ncbi:hypothetical protein EV421DRAFT_1906819 [Armillaria borealis]|uniref:Uncharacterized protein n=1 Tax=Armillaria borealis TaxID=47425 RepID=A0AA39JAB4_9AGAR|nr:hypothetical protein EV421DRAFT_1906819 [Armillaria borealis]
MVPSHPSTSSLPTPVSLDQQMSRHLQLNLGSSTSAPLFASDSSDADCSDVDSSDVDVSDSCSTDSTYMPSASSSDSRPTFFTSSRVGSALPTPQSNPSRSLYVWLLCHDGISEQVGVEKGVAPFLERGSSSNFELRLDIAMLHWLDPSNNAYVTSQHLRTFLGQVSDVCVWTYEDPMSFSQISVPSIVGSISRTPDGVNLQMVSMPWRIVSSDRSRPHTSRFFEMIRDQCPNSLLFVVFLTPSGLTPEAAPNSLPPPTAPLLPCPSMLQIPPIESWDEVFDELRSLLYRLQARSWHACYKHYAIVKFMRTMCFTLGLRPCYGSEGGMELVARWVLSQQCPPHKLLVVRPRTVANWVHLTFSDTEQLYLRFKEYIEGGGNIPADGTLRLFNTLKVWVTKDPAHLINQGTLTMVEFNALHPPWAQREFRKLVKNHLRHGPWS